MTTVMQDDIIDTYDFKYFVDLQAIFSLTVKPL